MRKLALALACASIFGTSNAQAMGLGEVVVRSYLNQPLLAEIPLVDVSAQDLENIRVRLANAQAFERQGLSLSAVSGRIQLQVQGGQRPHVVLTSKAPIHDPVLGLVLELEGPDGIIQRSYDILLDPVSYRAPLPNVSGADVPTAPKVADMSLQGSVENGYYRVREGETLWRVAYNLRPKGVSTEQMMAALREANPKAFASSGRSETLLSGAILRIPDTEEILRARARKQEAPVAPKASAEAVAPTAKAVESLAEPRVAIVAPDSPVPTVPAPVVGEVVSPPVTASEPMNGAGGESGLQEQLEAARVEKEQLLARFEAVEGQMQKMEELLHLKDEQIKQLEELLQAAAPGSEKTAPVEVKKSQPSLAAPSQPEEKDDLLTTLTQLVVLVGVGGVGVLLLALLIGRLRRRREEAMVQAAPVVRPEASAPVAKAAPMAAVAGAAVGGVVAATLAEEEASGAVIDPVQSVLEEVDVMQTYGLHERAREVLDEAITRMPEADVLQARRVRLFHEMGARDEFLRAAEAYRATHPAKDDPHWAAIQAIGTAAYADAPLFGGVAVVQSEPSGEAARASEVETIPEPHPSFVLPEAASELEQATAIQAGERVLELPSAPEAVEPLSAMVAAPEHSTQEEASIETLSLEWPALELGENKEAGEPRGVEPEPLPVFDLQSLSLEPAGEKVSSSVSEIEEALVLPEVASPESEAPRVSAAEAPAMAKMTAEQGISEDDLMLLGLDTVDLEAQPLDLLNLSVSEESQPTPSIAAAAPAVVEPVTTPGQAPVVPARELASAPSATPAEAFDERSIKLDMAEALIDLGDLDEARSMLEEVLSSGEDELSARARKMLERTSP
ncbi:MAG: FimV/HubP family polar landmark protein [Gammaproteobacteria bacterium]|nr:FimV/HubP family polar landmark protein [Gammaproteobacteria bacterium]